ncbi:MAG: glutamate--tRNA ligase [Proteobacteria bacterium]|nr:glutamate--tRNA ligase [Pseudomonadota bacterium]
MTVRVRFAPSPTGFLHVGNARIALVNWLFARAGRGRFILRIDDTDTERSTAAYARAIEEDLAWLGLDWDEFARQSDRMARYAAAFERLAAAGAIYPAYETPAELEAKRTAQLARGRPPVYDRAALALTEAARARLEAEGRRPHWRFRLPAGPVAWDDLVHGGVRIDAATLSDPVVFRADRRPLYLLTSAVDDAELEVSHVIRGEDHLTNTAVQIRLLAALGAEPERLRFAHLPLLIDAGGAGLSKRLGSLALRRLREEGIEPMAIASLLARLGSSDPVEPKARLADLVAGFDLARFSRAAPRFDAAELRALNARLLHALPFEEARPRLAALGLAGADAAFWEAVRGNLATLAEAKPWWRVCTGEIEPVIEDAAFAGTAAELLPPEPWDQGTFAAWSAALGAATGRRGRALYRPLRLALTGAERGPELKDLLPLLGRARARARLKGLRA